MQKTFQCQRTVPPSQLSVPDGTEQTGQQPGNTKRFSQRRWATLFSSSGMKRGQTVAVRYLQTSRHGSGAALAGNESHQSSVGYTNTRRSFLHVFSRYFTPACVKARDGERTRVKSGKCTSADGRVANRPLKFIIVPCLTMGWSVPF